MDDILHHLNKLWAPGDELRVHVRNVGTNARTVSTKPVYSHTGVPFAYFKRFFHCVQMIPGPPTTNRSHLIIQEHTSSLYHIQPYFNQNRTVFEWIVARWCGQCAQRPHTTVYIDLVRHIPKNVPTSAPTTTHLIERWKHHTYYFDKVCSGVDRQHALEASPTFHVSIRTEALCDIPSCVAGSLDLFQRVKDGICDIGDHSQVTWTSVGPLEKNST